MLSKLVLLLALTSLSVAIECGSFDMVPLEPHISNTIFDNTVALWRKSFKGGAGSLAACETQAVGCKGWSLFITNSSTKRMDWSEALFNRTVVTMKAKMVADKHASGGYCSIGDIPELHEMEVLVMRYMRSNWFRDAFGDTCSGDKPFKGYWC